MDRAQIAAELRRHAGPRDAEFVAEVDNVVLHAAADALDPPNKGRPAVRACTLDEVIDTLRDEVNSEGGAAAWSEAHGVDHDVVEALVSGGPARMTQAVLDALGFVAMVRYRRVTKPDQT